MCVCVCVWGVPVDVRASIHVCASVCLGMHLYMCLRVCVHVYVCMCVYVGVRMCSYGVMMVCVCVRRYVGGV